MAETTKVIYNDVVVIPNTIGGQSTGSTTYTNRCTARAGFSRPKPPYLFPTPMVIFRLEHNTGVYERGSGSTLRRGSLNHVAGSTIFRSTTISSGDGSLAMARARSKVSDFNFGESLVEFRETANLVTKRLSDAYLLFHNIKRGNWKALKKQGLTFSKDVRSASAGSKRLASGYLEAQFGWMPIITDIHSAIEAYGRTVSTEGDRVLKRSGNTRQQRYDGSGTPLKGDFIDPNSPLEANATYGGRVQSSAVYEANRLGLANPALMAWNALPFSFLADWFLPISPILGSLTAGMGLSGTFGSITTRSLSSTIGTSGPMAGVLANQTYNVNRSPASTVIGTPIDSKGVTFRVGQVATAVALVRQVLMR